ncbi:hypothetical protein BK126_15800 [Paenibacillus sp. FSL H7-0326]|uniref:hypothetical protein n=1 Tax=Paenibacillus sp. FSL H7-0326 TaxID=1921144 RepID=UPI00096F8E6D|nr:hypothetical protein [Paenibacillus sp. FSL H7-0326]OMC69219.1 hypothetical protein BK126_15800 [Paenibacillus sp. FSL H7-0326]
MSKKTVSMILFIVGVVTFIIFGLVREPDKPFLSLEFVLITLFTAGAAIYMIFQEKHELHRSMTEEQLLKMRKDYLLGMYGIGFVMLLQVIILFRELFPSPYVNGMPRSVDWSSVQSKVFVCIMFIMIWGRNVVGYFIIRNKKAENT